MLIELMEKVSAAEEVRLFGDFGAVGEIELTDEEVDEILKALAARARQKE